MRKVDVYSIDSGIPVPEDNQRTPVIPLAKLEVGDSILFPLTQRPTVQAYASRLKSKFGKVYTIKKMDDTNARVWRVE